MTARPEAHDKAPDFTLPTNAEGSFTLSQAGGSVVLFFYPKDDTPGCTTEAKDFTSLRSDFDALGVTLIGVSPDKAAKHDKFIAKHELAVVLGADEDQTVANAYGVWVEKSMYGKTYMGIERSTFLINAKGVIEQVWRKVKVKEHAQQVLDTARKMLA